MKRLFLATVLFSAIGCSVEQPPAAEPSTSSSTEELQLDPAAPNAERPFCRSAWNCDGVHWFAQKADCEASCGVEACVHEPHCVAGCICP